MIENRESFITRILGLDREDFLSVMFAYDMAKFAHGHAGQVREGNGQRYFEHPRHVTLILIDELGVMDPNLLRGSLLHDVPEDTGLLGNSHDGSYREWREVVRWRITKAFNSEVARMVLDVTKPFVDEDEIKSKDEGMEMYLENLRQARPDSIIIKMADRLHNLRTLDDVDPAKRVRKIHETEDMYYPIFRKGVLYDPVIYERLFGKISQEVERHLRALFENNGIRQWAAGADDVATTVIHGDWATTIEVEGIGGTDGFENCGKI